MLTINCFVCQFAQAHAVATSSGEAVNSFRQLVAELLELEGAAVEPLEPDALEVLAPPQLQKVLELPEMSILGFSPEAPANSRRVSLESEWMKHLGDLLGDDGRLVKTIIDVDCPSPGDPERILDHGLNLLNATHKLVGVRQTWTRYMVFTFRYTAISDEKRSGLLNMGFNLANGATIDDLIDELLLAPLTTAAKNNDEPQDLPPVWDLKKFSTILKRATPPRVNACLDAFVQSMNRRQERDLTRIYNYHNDLRREALERLSVLPTKEKHLTERHKAAKARDELRLAALIKEYQAKINDLRQKYALKIEVEWTQTREIVMPVQRFDITLKRRKGTRSFGLDWNPLARKLEQPPCEFSHASSRSRNVCDEALHLVSVDASGPCANCGKSYCRACYPNSCPKCGGREA